MSTSIRVLLVFKSAAEADEILTALHQNDLELSHRLVSSREELLQTLGSQLWDIIITDYRVTDLAASELLDHLKSTAQSIPTIIVAQSIGEERVASLMQAGAADYVGRGNWERLRAVVRREIRGTAQRAERKAATEARLSVHAEMEREIQRRNEELSRLNRLLRDEVVIRRQAEEAQAAISKKYQALIETNNDFIWETDAQGRYTYCSPQMELLWGIKPEDMLGKTPFDVMPEDKRADALKGFLQMARSPRAFSGLETVAYDGRGQLIHIETSGVPFFDHRDNLLGFRGITRDITERKRAEEALRASEVRYRGVVENTTAIILRVDPQGIIRFANQRALEFFGYSEEELIGQPAIGTIVPERESTGRDLVAVIDGIRTAPDQWHFNANENMRKNGERVWMEWTNSGVYDANGNLEEFLSVGIDATKSKEAEEALRESEERFRVAQDLSPDGFLIFRPLRDHTDAVTDFLWLYENDAAAGMNDTDPKEVRGKRVSEVLPHHDKSPFGRAYKEVAETGEIRVIDEAFYDQDTFQQRRWFRVVAVPAAHGDVAILVQDITERKKAEEALRQSEVRIASQLTEIESIYNNAGVGLCVVDRGFRFVRINSFLAKINGFSPEAHVGKTPWELVPSIAEAVKPIFERVFETGEAVRDFEFSAETPAQPGVKRIFREHWLPLKDSHGEVWGINIVVEEVTKFKHAEEALRQSEARFRNLVLHAPAAIYEIDFRTRRFTSVNDAMCHLSGYSREELLAMDAMEILDEPSRERFRGRIQRWLAGERPDEDVEYVAQGKDGHDIYAVLNVAVVPDEQGRARGAVVVAHDVTDRRRADAELLDAAEKYSTIINQVSDGVWIHNLDGQIVEVNSAYCRLSGYARGELVGSPISLVEAAESPSEIKTHIGTLVERGGHDRFESRHRRKDGIIWDVDVTAVFLPRDGGQIAVFVRDITERKRIEADLLTSQQRLRAALANPRLTVWQQDKDLRYVWLHNPRLGFDATGIVGKTDTDLLPPVQAARLTAIKREVLETGISSHEEVDLTHEGATAWFDLTIEPVRDETGAVIAINCISVELPPGKAKRRDVHHSETAFPE